MAVELLERLVGVAWPESQAQVFTNGSGRVTGVLSRALPAAAAAAAAAGWEQRGWPAVVVRASNGWRAVANVPAGCRPRLLLAAPAPAEEPTAEPVGPDAAD